MIDVIARLVAIVLCTAAGFAGVLWVSLELVDAVSTTGESAWYTTLVLAIAASRQQDPAIIRPAA